MFGLLNITILVLNVIIGSIPLFHDRKNVANITFSLTTYCINLWILTTFQIFNETHQILPAKIAYAVVSIGIGILLLFSLNYPKPRIKNNVKNLITIFAVPLLFSFISFTSFIITPRGNTGDFIFHTGHKCFTIFIFTYITIILYQNYQGLKTFKGEDKKQFTYYLIGLYSFMGLAATTNLILPLLGISHFSLYGSLFSILLTGFTYYAIQRHQLFNIALFMSYGTATLLTIITNASIYLFLLLFYKTQISTQIDLPFIICTLLFGTVVSVNFEHMRRFFQAATDQMFFSQLERETHRLKEEKAAAETANTIKSQFLAKMSHELRTPLHVILGSSQLLSQKLIGTQDPDIPNTLKILTQCSQNLLGLVNNILDLSKVEAGKIDISPKPLSLTHFLSRLPNWIAPMLTDKPITFTLQTDLKEIDWIQTDPDILHQILTNLLRNAVKFTPSGTISLTVYTQENTIHFAIQDSGIGISESDIPKLFSPFTQLSSTHAQEGTGLGLSICKDYAEKLGGTISVTSAPNIGSTFTLNAPLQIAQNLAPSTDPDPQPQSETPLKNTRVLLCDDNAFNRTFAHMLLKNKVTLTLADSGQQTLDLLKDNTFDILFLDIQMPDMDGVETLANIRSQLPHLNNMSIVALTAQAMTDDRDRLLRLGFDGYLAKPFTEKEILKIIQSPSPDQKR